MTLLVDVHHRQGDFEIATSFESSGRLTAIFGPSGSGKTSITNMISGLLRPDSGRIEVDGKVFVDANAGIFVPPHRRRIGYVFQDARLFPHLNVEQNLKYGRWFTPRRERYTDLDRITSLLGISHLLARKPASLSGGETQRVAIGRALLASPKLLLMDEPLASLDDARKDQILPYIERLRDELEIPVVYVSHSIAEVARLATDIVVLSAGHVVLAGPTADIMRRPDLLPIEEQGESGSVLAATVEGHDERYAMTALSTSAGRVLVPALDAAIGAKLGLRIRARDVMIAVRRPEGLSALNVLPGRIVSASASGSTQIQIEIACGQANILSRITRQSYDALGLAVGRDVFAVIKTVSFDRPNLALGTHRDGSF
ncbi:MULTISPECIES: molybdenum ABC transporter ATP-binding protein [Mesorhizobium]|uniref:Molybdenum ABC transporter ATP-binding protein n=1 Tax=Mesorhizobium denitrificans TaxID=2294114 RepID=A0A371XIG9_9HYPH|nr:MULTISPECIES: molybdenum ABC transporter ATP-binding protein [Mesorhizobium]RFC69013.1 molybdenum ABC transporter ATP-binding protein [Mesorhizobium denitrificans]